MYYLVYQITNLINGQPTVGCPKTLDKDDGFLRKDSFKRNKKSYVLEAAEY